MLGLSILFAESSTGESTEARHRKEWGRPLVKRLRFFVKQLSGEGAALVVALVAVVETGVALVVEVGGSKEEAVGISEVAVAEDFKEVAAEALMEVAEEAVVLGLGEGRLVLRIGTALLVSTVQDQAEDFSNGSTPSSMNGKNE